MIDGQPLSRSSSFINAIFTILMSLERSTKRTYLTLLALLNKYWSLGVVYYIFVVICLLWMVFCVAQNCIWNYVILLCNMVYPESVENRNTSVFPQSSNLFSVDGHLLGPQMNDFKLNSTKGFISWTAVIREILQGCSMYSTLSQSYVVLAQSVRLILKKCRWICPGNL